MRDYPFLIASPPTDSPASDSQHILEYLDHTNLFLVPLDNRREWYRYHNLFADLLCYRLKRAAPDQLLELQRRASGWYVRAGEIDAAMRHALTAPDYPLAAELAEQYAMRLIGGSRVATFLSWISQIPDEVIFAHAYLCAGCGWAFVLSGQVEAAERYVQAADAILPAFESLYLVAEECTISREDVYGHLIAIQAYCDRVRGDFSRAIEHSQQALTVLPPQAFSVRCVLALNLGLLHLQNGDLDLAQEAFSQAFLITQRSEENIYVAVSALSLQGDIAEKRGNLDEAVGYYQQAIRIVTHVAGSHRPVPAIGMAYGRLSAVHALRDEKATALHYLEKALALVEQIGSPEMLAYAYLFKAQLASESGNFTEAETLIGKASEGMQSFEVGDELKTTWVVARGEFHLLQGEIRAAGEWLQSQAVLVADLEGVEPRTAAQAFSLG